MTSNADRELVERLKRQIDSFASPALRNDRQALWADIEDRYDHVGLLRLLSAVVSARFQKVTASDDATERLRNAAYWKERDKLDRQMQEIASHRLVRYFPLPDVDFYPPDRVRCEHGRDRKVCEDISAKLNLVSLLRPLAAHHRSAFLAESGADSEQRTNLERRAAEVERELRDLGADPIRDRPESYCQPGPAIADSAPASLEDDPVRLEQRRAGRPADPARDALLRSVVSGFQAAGTTIAEACDVAARVLRLCFSDEVDAESLERHWRRRQERQDDESRRT